MHIYKGRRFDDICIEDQTTKKSEDAEVNDETA